MTAWTSLADAERKLVSATATEEEYNALTPLDRAKLLKRVRPGTRGVFCECVGCVDTHMCGGTRTDSARAWGRALPRSNSVCTAVVSVALRYLAVMA